MTEQTSPVPPKAHAPSPLDIPARGAAQQARPLRGRPPPRSPRGASPAAQPRRQPATPPAAAVKVTGAQALVLAMERVGVEVVFGIPGGAVLPAYDPLLDSKQIRHILVRHEQGAGHAATGYAQATGRTGVCMATSGPGATNLVTPLADAYMDSRPRGRDHRPGLHQPDRHRRVPGGGHLRDHVPDHQAQLPRHQARGHRPHHRRGLPPGQHGQAGPGAGGHRQGRAAGEHRVQLAGRVRPARLPPGHQAAFPAGQGGGQDDHRGQAARPLRRRRCDQGRRLGRAEDPGRAHRRPGGHHADGAGRVPRQPPAAPGHARHARHGRRGRRAAAGGPDRGARRPVRRPGDGQARLVRAGRPGRARGHRPGRDLQEPPGRRADRR